MATPSRRRGAKTNVAELPSSLVGRQGDLEAIGARFDGGARLVTIVAPGGMGKTRVASRFAATRAEDYAAHGGAGAWICDLTEARTALDVCAIVGVALGVRVDGGAALGRAIAHRKRLLLVLDNFEQIVGVAAETLGAWMAAAPHAHFLVTSRVVLGLPGEHLWPLVALEEAEATELFLARARALRPGFSAGDGALLGALVRRTDGIPLAIELAAARAGALSLAELHARLDAPLELLRVASDRGRHGSMRRAIADSYGQLDEAERDCLVRASLFRGGFTLEAAEQVLGPSLRALEALQASSLVRTLAEADGELRFSFYETIREFASEQLAQTGAQRDALAERHARYYRGLAAVLSASEARPAATRRLDRERENLGLAHAYAVARGDREGASMAVTLALALDRAHMARGTPQPRIDALDAALQAVVASGAARGIEVAEAHVARGLAHRDVGAFEAARADLETGLGVAQAASAPLLEALVHTRLGELRELMGSTVEAKLAFERALACTATASRGLPARLREADARARLGHTHRREGDLDAAERETERAVELYRVAGHDEELAAVLYEAATIALFRARYDASRARFAEGLGLATAAGARHVEAALTTAFGTMLLEEGKLDEALAHHTRGVQLFRAIGNRYREGSALYYLARSYALRGARDEAEKTLLVALELVRAARVPRYEVLIEAFRAALHADAGRGEAARDAIARAEEAAHACESEPTLVATLAIHRLHLGLEGAAPKERARRRREAEALSVRWPCDDPRFAHALFSSHDLPTDARTLVLTLEDGGNRVRAPGVGTVIDLERRAPLRRILLALARHRVEAPGDTLSLDEIVAAGWPGERMDHASATNRVYVALSTLRRLGLRDAIVRGEGGYLISTTLSVERTDDLAAPSRS